MWYMKSLTFHYFFFFFKAQFSNMKFWKHIGLSHCLCSPVNSSSKNFRIALINLAKMPSKRWNCMFNNPRPIPPSPTPNKESLYHSSRHLLILKWTKFHPVFLSWIGWFRNEQTSVSRLQFENNGRLVIKLAQQLLKTVSIKFLQVFP